MPKVEFIDDDQRASAVVDVPAGGSLADICLEHSTPIPITCDSGVCGGCQLRVLAGEEYLEPPDMDEMDFLEVLGGPREARLACQVRLKDGEGVVRVESLLVRRKCA